MSLNNLEIVAYNSLSNLSSIYADDITCDTLQKVDPTITDADFDTLQGINTTLTIQQQFDGIETQLNNIGASYWFSAWDTTTQTNPVANTPRIVTWNNSDPQSTGITNGPVSGSIKVLNTNTYNIQFSFQLHQTSSSNSSVTIWLRKNGNDVPASAGEYDVKGNDHLVTAWNYVMALEANDYIQFYWASDSTSMTLDYQVAQTSPYSHPAIPSVIITLVNVTGEGPQGIQGATGATGPRGDRGPKGDKGDTGDSGDGPVAYSALALATAADAAAIALGVTVAGLSSTVAGQGVTITGLVGSQATQDTAITNLQAKTIYQSAGLDPGGMSETNFVSTLVLPNWTGPGNAVRLTPHSENTFMRLIRCPQIIANTGGTSSFSSIVTSDYLDVSGNITTTGAIYLNNKQNSGLKLILYDGVSGQPSGLPNNYNGISMAYENTSGFTNIYNVALPTGFTLSSHNFTYSDTISSTRSLLKFNRDEFNITNNAINFRDKANATSLIDAGINITAAPGGSINNYQGTMAIEANRVDIAENNLGSLVNINNNNNQITNIADGNDGFSNISNGNNCVDNLFNGNNNTINIANGNDNTITIGTSPNPLSFTTVEIGALLGYVTINGIVNFSGNNFNFTSGFFTQW